MAKVEKIVARPSYKLELTAKEAAIVMLMCYKIDNCAGDTKLSDACLDIYNEFYDAFGSDGFWNELKNLIEGNDLVFKENATEDLEELLRRYVDGKQ